MNADLTMKKIGPVVLRVGMAAVILWFGIAQGTNPSAWFGYLPAWTAHLPISQMSVIYINSFFEIVFGFLLFVGFYTRWVALLLALHLFDIAITVGYGAIGVRDFGLAIATLAIFFEGTSAISADMFFRMGEGL